MLKKSVMNNIVMLEKMGICDTQHGYVKKSWLYVIHIMVMFKSHGYV